MEWRQDVEVMPSKPEDDVLEDKLPKLISVMCRGDILTTVKLNKIFAVLPVEVASPFQLPCQITHGATTSVHVHPSATLT
jgi:hypothetical protein